MKISATQMFCITVLTLPMLGCSTTNNVQPGQASLSGGLTEQFTIKRKSQKLAPGTFSGELAKKVPAMAQQKALIAEYKALEKGQAGVGVTWNYGKSHKGEVIPAQPYQVGSSSCRRYVHKLYINQTLHTQTTTACRDKEGNWVPLT